MRRRWWVNSSYQVRRGPPVRRGKLYVFRRPFPESRVHMWGYSSRAIISPAVIRHLMTFQTSLRYGLFSSAIYSRHLQIESHPRSRAVLAFGSLSIMKLEVATPGTINNFAVSEEKRARRFRHSVFLMCPLFSLFITKEREIPPRRSGNNRHNQHWYK